MFIQEQGNQNQDYDSVNDEKDLKVEQPADKSSTVWAGQLHYTSSHTRPVVPREYRFGLNDVPKTPYIYRSNNSRVLKIEGKKIVDQK